MSKYAFQDSDKTERDLTHLKEVIDFAEGIFRGATAEKMNRLKNVVESSDNESFKKLLTQLENRGNHVIL
jgi:hypothetical protein